MSQLIDTHCHLETYVEKGILLDVLNKTDTAGLKRMIAVGTSPKDWVVNQMLANKYSSKICYSIGLHPCYVGEYYIKDIEKISQYIENFPHPIAIGEIGLDYFHLPKNQSKLDQIISNQKDALRLQLIIASNYELPVIIHSRNAFLDCVSLIDSSPLNWKKVVFHCFSEGLEEIKIINKKGGRASFTGIITYKKSESIKKAALQQGLSLLMLETDAPYLSPEPYRGKRNEPSLLRYTAEFCSSLFNVSPEKLTEITTRNATEFFGL